MTSINVFDWCVWSLWKCPRKETIILTASANDPYTNVTSNLRSLALLTRSDYTCVLTHAHLKQWLLPSTRVYQNMCIKIPSQDLMHAMETRKWWPLREKILHETHSIMYYRVVDAISSPWIWCHLREGTFLGEVLGRERGQSTSPTPNLLHYWGRRKKEINRTGIAAADEGVPGQYGYTLGLGRLID